jgi:hypothetical protein
MKSLEPGLDQCEKEAKRNQPRKYKRVTDQFSADFGSLPVSVTGQNCAIMLTLTRHRF